MENAIKHNIALKMEAEQSPCLMWIPKDLNQKIQSSQKPFVYLVQ